MPVPIAALNYSERVSIGVRAAAGVAALLVCASAAAAHPWRSETLASKAPCGARFGPLSYPWPLWPFDEPHPVRGNFGDPRTVFREGGPASADARGSFVFHNGVDIEGKARRNVYPVVSGVVSRVREDEIVVSAPGGRDFQYWHLRPEVRPGELVTASRTVLGTIRPEAHHVHLTEVDEGFPQNPLAPGHLSPYIDRIAPTVASIGFLNARGRAVGARSLRGRVEIVASAYDLPSLPVEGAWLDMPVSPAALEWRLTTPAGKVVVPEEVAVDFRDSLPVNREFWDVYSRGTYQNFPVIDREFMWRVPGRYLFDLTPDSLDTSELPAGSYLLTATALDVCGNSGSLTERVRVLPQASVRAIEPRLRPLVHWRPRTGFTVILTSVPLADGSRVARAVARLAIRDGLRRVGILDSSRFASLVPGYYAVFSGVYAHPAAARRELERTARFFPAAYPREVAR
jgi:hypothetical protein